MRTWNVVVLLLVAAFVAAPCVQAQSNDDLRKEVNQLKADLQKLIDNAVAFYKEDTEEREAANEMQDLLNKAMGKNN